MCWFNNNNNNDDDDDDDNNNNVQPDSPVGDSFISWGKRSSLVLVGNS